MADTTERDGKAMTTDARELAERIVREYERCQIEGCDPTCLQTRLYKAFQAGRLSGLQQAASAVRSEFYGHDTGEMADRINELLDELLEKIAEEEK